MKCDYAQHVASADDEQAHIIRPFMQPKHKTNRLERCGEVGPATAQACAVELRYKDRKTLTAQILSETK
jgi:hypothetical protein